jgi:hypothetical protein
VAAGLALSGLTMTPGWAANPQNTNPNLNQSANPSDQTNPNELGNRPDGTLVTDESQAKSIRNVLAEVTTAAVTKDGISTIIGDLSKADRDRMDKEKDNKYEDLNQAAAQFQQDWKNKYNSDFKIRDVNQVFTDQVPIFQGDVPERMAAGATAKPMTPPHADDRTQDQKLMATVFFAPNRDAKLPQVQVYLYNEGTILNSWKIELNGQADVPRLHEALLNHLNRLHDEVGQWPDNQDTAARVVSQSVLAALTDAARGSQAMAPSQNGTEANTR